MIFGIGVDIVETERIVNSLERFGERFEKKMFTETELAYCKRLPHPALHFAARFAAKEAFLKALGTGKSQGIAWRDVGVSNIPSGKPVLTIEGKARQLVDDAKITGMHVTLTHSATNAVAVVVLEQD